jgi:hypothetical protein
MVLVLLVVVITFDGCGYSANGKETTDYMLEMQSTLSVQSIEQGTFFNITKFPHSISVYNNREEALKNPIKICYSSDEEIKINMEFISNKEILWAVDEGYTRDGEQHLSTKKIYTTSKGQTITLNFKPKSGTFIFKLEVSDNTVTEKYLEYIVFTLQEEPLK